MYDTPDKNNPVPPRRGRLPSTDPDGAMQSYFWRKWEKQERIKDRWRMLTGLTDFAGVIFYAALILVLFALIVSLITWLVRDMNSTFSVLLTLFQ